jgi:beta-glucosidase
MGEYVDGPRTPLFPFGFGLTYTTFEYGKVELSARTLKAGGSLTVRARLKNSGARAGSEVAQLYLCDTAASAGPRPVRELKGFRKVRLQPGQAQDVEFIIGDRELGYCDANGRRLVEPGRFQVWIAKDAASGEPADFELVK